MSCCVVVSILKLLYTYSIAISGFTSYCSYMQGMSPEEREEIRRAQVNAAQNRAGSFKQGGGGEALKAKAKRKETAERNSGGLAPGQMNLADARAWD